MRPETSLVRPVCSRCGAPVVFDPAGGGLRCGHCRHLEPVARVPVTLEARPLESAPEAVESAAMGVGTVATECQACGAVVERGADVIAERCPWCASTLVRPTSAVSSGGRPTALIPFVIGRERLAEVVGGWLKGLWLRRGDLRPEAMVADAVGVYAPFYLYAAKVKATWTAERGVRGKDALRWEPAKGTHAEAIEAVAVCASRGVPTVIADRLEVPPLYALTAFDPLYLEGFRAERPAIDRGLGWSHALTRIQKRFHDAVAKTVGGETHRGLHLQLEADEVRWRLLLVPVWVASYVVDGRPYRVIVDGARGRVEGEAPYSLVKLGAVAAAVLVALFLLVTRKG